MQRLPRHVRRHPSGRFRAVVARGDGTRWHGPLRDDPAAAAVDAARFRGTLDARGAITFDEALALVLIDLEQTGARPATHGYYRKHLRSMLGTPIWSGDMPLAAVSHAQVRAYVDIRQERGVSPGVVWGKEIQVLSRMIRCALESGHLTIDPLLGLKRPKIRAKRFDHLTAEQIAAIRAKVLEPVPGVRRRRQERDAAMLDFLFGTGLRRAEFARLRVSHVNFDAREVLVDGKTAARVVPLEGIALRAAETLADGRGPLEPFAGHYNTIERAFARISAVSGVRVSPHILRHSFASDCARRGVEAMLLATILGHHDLRQTLRYFHAAADKARAAIRGVGDHR
jgi:site-specific recombinase XerD